MENIISFFKSTVSLIWLVVSEKTQVIFSLYIIDSEKSEELYRVLIKNFYNCNVLPFMFYEIYKFNHATT